MAMVPIWSLLQQKHPEHYEPLKVIIIIFVDIIRYEVFNTCYSVIGKDLKTDREVFNTPYSVIAKDLETGPNIPGFKTLKDHVSSFMKKMGDDDLGDADLDNQDPEHHGKIFYNDIVKKFNLN